MRASPFASGGSGSGDAQVSAAAKTATTSTARPVLARGEWPVVTVSMPVIQSQGT
ncbi:hypothetical protein GCM10009754_71290 [Amycolatopsis minnesotensis]|uniref:Uncharacterized protein n=1 Tax=Amycolatopsis minnesotensis TaxID=337894 RepID=A0ABN2SC95_9PSEU